MGKKGNKSTVLSLNNNLCLLWCFHKKVQQPCLNLLKLYLYLVPLENFGNIDFFKNLLRL